MVDDVHVTIWSATQLQMTSYVDTKFGLLSMPSYLPIFSAVINVWMQSVCFIHTCSLIMPTHPFNTVQQNNYDATCSVMF